MKIDTALISYLEDLTCLTLSDGEKIRLVEDLENIINGIARLDDLQTDGVQERSHPFDNVNAFREDAARPSLDRALILQNAPVRSDTMFIAPRTVD